MDIRCAVCGEPWDAWGARHGDMRKWEYDLFRMGAGCPCCQGEGSRDAGEDHVRDAWLSGATDDPDSFILGFGGPIPKWEPPAPTLLWTCATCEVSAGHDPEHETDELVWIGGQAIHYSYGYAASYGGHYQHEEPEDEPFFELGDDGYCPGCADICSYGTCEAVILLQEDRETYAPGARFPDVLAGSPFRASNGICTDCFEQIPSCGYCGEYYEDHEQAEVCCND